MLHRILIMASLISISAFAKDNPLEYCLQELTPVTTDVNGVLFHNAELAEMVKDGLTAQSLYKIVRRLYEAGTFEIPKNNKGFVTAADVGDHPGHYGEYFWLRDLARIYMGAAARTRVLKELNLPRQESARQQREIALAMLQVLKSPDWTKRAMANINNPSLHADPQVGQQSVIRVRYNAKPFQENRPLTPEEEYNEANWGHRQNDALGAFGLAVMTARELRDVTPEEFAPAQENLDLLATYLAKLGYPHMWDMGAWEEQLAKRSSSISIVTSFEEAFMHSFSAEKNVDFEDIRAKVNDAYSVLTPRLTGTRMVEADEGERNGPRFEDSAEFHSLWWPLARFSSDQYLQMIDKLDAVLKRSSGYARYEHDWFLYGPAIVAKHADKNGALGKMVLANGKVATPEDLNQLATWHDQHMYDKDMSDILKKGGEGFEAQWTIPDAILVSYYVDLYLQTYNNKYREKAKEHYLRLLGLVTGDTDMTVEGKKIGALKAPEAYTPVRMLINGEIKTVYYTSPNSPLNWGVAELIMASEEMLRAL